MTLEWKEIQKLPDNEALVLRFSFDANCYFKLHISNEIFRLPLQMQNKIENLITEFNSCITDVTKVPCHNSRPISG